MSNERNPGTDVLNKQHIQRPPSRHKDPPQNIGLDLYPPEMPDMKGGRGNRIAMQNPKKSQPAGIFGHGGGFVKLDIESDFKGDSEGDYLDADADNSCFFIGHGRVPTQKKFKEDEEDYF